MPNQQAVQQYSKETHFLDTKSGLYSIILEKPIKSKLPVMTFTLDSSHTFIWILLNIMLPKSQNGPTITTKPSGNHYIPSHVPFYLISPEFL